VAGSLAGHDNNIEKETMLNFFFRKAVETKAQPPLVALQLVQPASLGARDYPSLAREAILANAVAYRCVRMIAEGCASVP
jgi:phage portal protein BeeE